MLVPRLLTQQTSEAMHVQGNDGQSNRSSKSLRTFRPNTVEATVFKIVDGRLHSGVLTAHGSKGFTLFAVSISLAEVALLGGGKACNGVPQREGIGDQVGRSLICCRNFCCLNLLWSAGEHIYQFGLANFSRHGEIEGSPVPNTEIQQQTAYPFPKIDFSLLIVTCLLK